MERKPLIAIAGKAGAGKTTLAKALAEHYGIPLDSFARPLKEGCRILGAKVDGPDKDRDILQQVGLLFREKNPYHWIDLLERRHPDMRETGLVIDDMRFLNERAWAFENDFFSVYLLGSFAPLDGAAAHHPSEVSFDERFVEMEFDLVIPHDTTVEERVCLVVEEYEEFCRELYGEREHADPLVYADH